MSKCRQFLEGLPHFDLVVDHNPLVPILNDYVMDNRRLLRLRLKMQRYAFTARSISGKHNMDADALLFSHLGTGGGVRLLGEERELVLKRVLILV